MAAGDEYSAGGGGRLKLKGSKVSDGRVDKKKKKSKKNKEIESPSASTPVGSGATAPHEEEGIKRRDDENDDEQHPNEAGKVVVEKTEAERKHEETRKKRLQERVKREGAKTHKERVEELNKYLSRLSEHHDMPKIGPG